MKRVSDSNVIYSIFLMVILIAFMFMTSLTIMNLAESACYRTLESSSEELAVEVVRDIDDNCNELKVIASCLAQIETDKIRDALSNFQKHGVTSALGVLLPDGTLIYCGPEHSTTNTDVSFLENLYFSNEKIKAPYISNLQLSADGYKYIYRAVPIMVGNEVKGILYGFISPDRLAEFYNVGPFGDNSAVSIIEDTSGEYIVNGIGDSNDSIYNNDMLQSEVAEGDSIESMYNDIANGVAGHIAFKMSNADDFIYTYYMPIGVNNWTVILSVDKNTAFADAVHTKFILNLFATALCFILIVYFAIVLSNARKRTAKKERQLRQTVNMFEVQQILLDASKTPDAINEAMRKTAEILNAESVFVISLKGSIVSEIYYWGEVTSLPLINLKGVDLYKALPDSAPVLMRGENVFYDDKKSVNISELGSLNIANAMFVSLTDSSKNVLGVLGGINTECMLVDPDFMESIARNFLMALNNVESYRKIREMGSMDALTGLKNRHCYQSVLDSYDASSKEACSCIYLDVNGLHELNNSQGHTAGDKMLKFVAQSMADSFGNDCVYRIGGDEFVALCKGLSKAAADNKVKTLVDKVRSNGYEVAVGVVYDSAPESLSGLVIRAEMGMYEDKDRYYKSKGIESKAR
jgi:diguanylate cyclase (GGDEF)-like protein